MPGTWGIAYVKPELDPVDFISGVRLTSIDEGIEVHLMDSSGIARPDVVLSLFTIFSERLKLLLDMAGVENIDYYQAKIIHPNGDIISEKYYVANIIGLIDAVDQSTSKLTPQRGKMPSRIKQFYINNDNTNNLNVFRIVNSPSLIIISNRIKVVIENAILSGVYLLPTQKWTGTPGVSYFD